MYIGKLALSRSEAKYINLGESIQIPTTTKRGSYKIYINKV